MAKRKVHLSSIGISTGDPDRHLDRRRRVGGPPARGPASCGVRRQSFGFSHLSWCPSRHRRECGTAGGSARRSGWRSSRLRCPRRLRATPRHSRAGWRDREGPSSGTPAWCSPIIVTVAEEASALNPESVTVTWSMFFGRIFPCWSTLRDCAAAVDATTTQTSTITVSLCIVFSFPIESFPGHRKWLPGHCKRSSRTPNSRTKSPGCRGAISYQLPHQAPEHRERAQPPPAENSQGKPW